jgi:hypothetical protein
MTPKTKATVKNVSIALGAVLAVFSVASGATRFVSVAVGAADHRYLQRDTFFVYQAGQAEKERATALANARRDSLLHRVDRRIGLIYCSSLPPEKRAGCE